MKRKETTFYQDLKKIIEKNYPNSFVWKFPDSAWGIKPFDLIWIYQGKVIGLELKVENEDFKKHQIYFLNKLKKAGGLGFGLVKKKDENLTLITFSKITINSKTKTFFSDNLNEALDYILTWDR